MSLLRRLFSGDSSNISNILLNIGVRGCTAGGTFILGWMLARVLSIDEFGQYALCFTALIVTTILARLGIDIAIHRFGGAAWFNDKKQVFSSYCNLALKSTLGLSSLLTLVAIPVTILASQMGYVQLKVAAWIIVAIIPYTLIYIYSSILKSAGMPKLGAAFEVGGVSAVAAVVIAIMYWLDVTITAAIGAMTLSFSAIAVLAVVMLVAKWMGIRISGGPKLTKLEKKAFFTSSTELGVTAITNTLAIHSGSFFLALHWTDADIAGFSAALRLVSLTIVLRNVVIFIVNPKLAGMFAAGDMSGFQKLARKSALQIGVLCSFALLPMVIAPSLMMSIYGPEFQQHAPLLATMAVGQIIATLTCVAPGALAMAGREKQLRKVTLGIGLTCLLLNYVLTYNLSAFGAACGAAVYFLSLGISLMLTTHNQLGVWAIPRIPLGVKKA